ncbi:MAG: type II secretion system F family protein [Streptosporangiaceae bacterium]
MTIIVALAGALVAAGLMLALYEIVWYRPRPGIPPRPAPLRLSRAARLRVLTGIVVGLVALLVSGWPVLGLAAAVAIILLPRLSSSRAARRRTAVLEGLEQWARRLSDLLSASRGLEDALEVSARSAPAVIAAPVTALARGLAARTGSDAALRAFADEIDDPAGDRIVAALIIATGRRGGAVGEVLRTLAEQLARDVASRRDIDADRAEHRTTLKWIVGIVIAFTVFCVLNRSFSAPFGTPLGELVLALIAVLYIVGLSWLARLGNIDAPARFLVRKPGRATAPASSVPASQPRVAR